MNIYKEKSRHAFNDYAERYDDTNCCNHAKKLYKDIIKEVENISFNSMLDVGCGTGEIINIIKNKNDKAEYYGLDLSENMIKAAGNKLGNEVDLIVSDSENLPYENNKFDLILCNDSFHHYPNPLKVLGEMHRVLKDSGYLLIGECYQPIISREIMNVFMKFSRDGDVKIYSKKEFIKMLNGVGFKDIDYKKVNHTSCVIKAKNKLLSFQ